MGINKNNLRLIVLVERPDTKEIIEQIRLRLHTPPLPYQTAEVTKVCENSQIKESRHFTKEQVFELILYIAKTHKIELSYLQLSKIVTNPQGTILVLEVKCPNLNDEGHQLINFTLKGRHDRNESGTTSIDRTYWDEDDMPEPPYGDNIAEFIEGEWCFQA